MTTMQKRLLIIDGGVNLLLGALLLSFPLGTAAWLGVPRADSAFYPTILGGVLFGIGLALLIEAYTRDREIRGLGIAGAIAVNFCGAGVLAVWLAAASLPIPLRGQMLLGSIAIVVLALGVVELVAIARHRGQSAAR
ncbi:MAG: hypothetical protein QNJ61_15170 [Desulfobacterales bacterium]|nr:hypothetical protein [Desulfobacterales bacterium]